MPCKNLRGQLSLYASGDLDESHAQAVRDHLRLCPQCRMAVQSFEKTRSLLGSYARDITRTPGANSGPSLWNGVMGRMNQKPFRGKGPQPPKA
jgi:anti-sigma factor RsiW